MEGLAGRVAIFATITSGIASLPIEPSYFELGPVFDLDYLDWRTNPSGDQETAGTSLPIEVYRAIQDQLGTAEANTEEALRLARLFQQREIPPSSASSRARIALCISSALIRKPSLRSSRSPTAGSCRIGALLSFSKDQIDSELDGGKCNGTAADQRLAAMLSSRIC